MRAEIYQVVTFAKEPFAGNPAFVVDLPRDVSDATLQAVAGQLNELVLASLRISDDDSTSVSFHTREGRHGGTGHTMMAAAHVALGRLGDGAREVTIALNDGSQRTVSRQGSRIAVPWPIMPATVVQQKEALGGALGLRPSETLSAPFGYVAMYDEPDQIENLQPDMQALAQLDCGAIMAAAPGDGSDFVLRVFAPKLGIPEDPVCGTAHRILVPYWAKRLGRNTVHSRQLSPRGGELWCWLDDDSVVISGESVSFLKGVIELPNDRREE